MTNDPVVVVTGPEGRKNLVGDPIDYSGTTGQFQVIINGADQRTSEYVQFRANVNDTVYDGPDPASNWGTTTTYDGGNVTTTNATKNFSFVIDDQGVYQFQNESSSSIWNTDATEVTVQAIIVNAQAKVWGLIAGTSTEDVTVTRKFTISKSRVGSAVDIRLKRDPVIIATNTKGDFCLLYTSPSPRDS